MFSETDGVVSCLPPEINRVVNPCLRLAELSAVCSQTEVRVNHLFSETERVFSQLFSETERVFSQLFSETDQVVNQLVVLGG